MSRVGRSAVALAAAAVVLAVMAWFDTTVVSNAAQREAQTFDMSGYALVEALGTILIAGSVLLLALLAWRSRSVAVGVAYALVGAYFALQLWITWTFAAQANGAPPVLPYPLDRAVNHVFSATYGRLNAVGIVGAGMLVAGVAVLAQRFRERTRSSVPG
jgi:hypothetical protein